MDPITLAAGILSATGLGDWLGDKLGGIIGAKAADKVIDVAKAVTGLQSPEEITARLQQDAQLAAQLRNKLLDNEQEIIRLEFADRADARAMYKIEHGMADKLAHQVMLFNLPAVVLLLLANCLVVYFIKDAAISLAVGNLIGGSISYLWQERQAIINFFFGSSQGSKDKACALGQR